MVFALLLIFTFGLAFNAVQANTIAAVLRDAHTVPTQLSGIVLALLGAPVFFGGIRAVARVAEWLLPAMALAYIALALVMLALHLDHIPAAFPLIVRSAFGLQPAVAGVSGGIAAAMLNGVKRGLFSNEAGMGSARPTPLQPRPLPIPRSKASSRRWAYSSTRSSYVPRLRSSSWYPGSKTPHSLQQSLAPR